MGRLCAFGAAPDTVTDRVPKTLWQVHSPIHCSSPLFDSLGNKIAVLPSDDKNQITLDSSERLIGLFCCFYISCDNFLAVNFLCCTTFWEHSWNKGKRESSAMIEVIFYREREVQEDTCFHFLCHSQKIFIYILLEKVLNSF